MQILESRGMRYKADITAGALKLPESRLIADLLLRHVDAEGWKDAIVTKNVLQARNPATTAQATAKASRTKTGARGREGSSSNRSRTIPAKPLARKYRTRF